MSDKDSSSSEEEEKKFEDPFVLTPTPTFLFDFCCFVLMGAFIGVYTVGYLDAVSLLPAFWYHAQNNSDFPENPDTWWYVQGRPWWILVGLGVGLVHGLLRAITLIGKYPGFEEILHKRKVDPLTALQTFFLCIITNIGGGSMGPEVGQGAACALIGQTFALLLQLVIDFFKLEFSVYSELFVSAAVCAGLAPFFPSPIIAIVLCAEIGLPFGVPDSWRGYSKMHILSLHVTSALTSFAIFSLISDKTYLDFTASVVLLVETEEIQLYHFLIGILFGFMGAILAMIYVLMGGVAQAIFGALSTGLERLAGPRLPLAITPIIGGIAYGVIMFVFPLTEGSGSETTSAVIAAGAQVNSTLPSGLLVASVAMKMVSFWFCAASGLVGGSVFPILFIGAVMGEVFAIWTGLNQVVAVSCGIACVAGAVAPIPLTLIFLAVTSVTQGVQAWFPVTATVFTAYVCLIGIGFPQTLIKFGEKRKAKKEAKSKPKDVEAGGKSTVS